MPAECVNDRGLGVLGESGGERRLDPARPQRCNEFFGPGNRAAVPVGDQLAVAALELLVGRLRLFFVAAAEVAEHDDLGLPHGVGDVPQHLVAIGGRLRQARVVVGSEERLLHQPAVLHGGACHVEDDESDVAIGHCCVSFLLWYLAFR